MNANRWREDMDIISFCFHYEDAQYQALARVKQGEEETEYYITVMHGELEKKLFGYHLYLHRQDRLFIGALKQDSQLLLRQSIGVGLQQRIANAANISVIEGSCEDDPVT